MQYRKAFYFILASLASIFLKFIFVYFLPYPWSQVNFVAIMVVLALAFSESGAVVWPAFCSYFALELYSADYFGILLCSGTVSALFSVWLYRYFFTNRSWYAITSIAVAQVLIFRVFYSFFLLITKTSSLGWYKPLAIEYFIEIILSAVITAAVYLVVSLIGSKKAPRIFTFSN